MPDYRIRQATASDASVIARHRVGMFSDMGELTPDEAVGVAAASRDRLVEDLATGRYLGWLVETGGEVVAGAGVLLHDYYPNRANPRGRPTAYILNVYTEPAHRRRGLAHRLVSEILAWCRAHDVPRASLHASSFGKSVYARVGFEPTNEMRIAVSSTEAPSTDRESPPAGRE